jgi:hypothetical protein
MEGRQAHLSRPTVWVAIPESGRSLTVQVKALVVDQLGGPFPRKRVWPTQSRLRGCLYLRRYQVCACAPLRSPVSARSRASALGLASAFRRALVKSRSLNRIAALPAQWTELVWPVDRRRRPSKLNAGNDRRGALTLEAGAAALGGLLPIRLPAGMLPEPTFTSLLRLSHDAQLFSSALQRRRLSTSVIISIPLALVLSGARTSAERSGRAAKVALSADRYRQHDACYGRRSPCHSRNSRSLRLLPSPCNPYRQPPLRPVTPGDALRPIGR